MYLVDLLGALLTVLALAFLAAGGYLLALRLLGDRAVADPLALAVAALLLALAEAIGIALLLGALGVLRIDLALGIAGLVALGLLVPLRRRPPPGGIGRPLEVMARRGWQVAAEYWAPSLIAVHAVGAEALRGLLQPPLSWDSLAYHLLLAGTWLRDQNLAPVFGPIPVNYYGYAPANGSLWFWWWMAPSHSELWVNLASLLPWALLCLASGAIARQLGAARHWPLAAFVVGLLPTVVRFAATEYVDLVLSAMLLGGLFFGLRWLREPEWGAALLLGAGIGVAAGTKVLGVIYGMAVGGAIVLLARGQWRRRLLQIGVTAIVAALLGGYFYIRNAALGAGPLALACEQTAGGREAAAEGLPRPGSVLGSWPQTLRDGRLVEAFLGTSNPRSLEMGFGPAALLLLAAALVVPWLVPRERRREAWAAALVVLAMLAFCLAVPWVHSRHIYATVRYLIPAAAIACGAMAAFAERRGVRERLLQGLALAFLVQSLLQQHVELSFAGRIGIALVDVAAAVLVLSPVARAVVAQRWRKVAAVALVVALLAAPALARYRIATRGKAFATEVTLHPTMTPFFAGAWSWLDTHAGSDVVAMSYQPNHYLTYPEMGPRLERDARYVNVNAADRRYAAHYPRCEPRVDPSPQAWVRNLVRARVRWLHVARIPRFEFPLEDRWARALSGLFTLRYEDPNNRIYELHLPASNASR